MKLEQYRLRDKTASLNLSRIESLNAFWPNTFDCSRNRL